MPKKSFVSISFTSSTIQVLKLSSSLKEVSKYGIYEIPEGAVSNYQVVQKEKLTDLIKRVWKEQRIAEKTVGIVVPEFSTYVKTLTFPKLTTEDLDEAVKWQAQDFFTSSGQDMSLDWKVVGQDERNYYVLTVAIQTDVLAGYVDAIADAGLYPIVVETPALSLSRIGGPGPRGKLLVYTTNAESILVVAQGENIIGSSVIATSDTQSLSITARQIIAHYQNTGVQEILVGGTNVTQELMDELARLGKVDWLQIRVTGLPPEDLQKFLVPISLQFKDPAEPRSEETVNLLPQSWVDKYQKKRTALQIRSLVLISSLVIWGCFLIVFGVRTFLSNEVKNLSAETEQFEKQTTSKHGDKIAKVDEINDLGTKYETILAASTKPQDTLNKLNEVKPDGVNITSYHIDYEGGTMKVTGKARDRQSLVDYKRALEEVDGYEQVSVPVSSLVGEGELDFDITILTKTQKESKPKIKLQL